MHNAQDVIEINGKNRLHWKLAGFSTLRRTTRPKLKDESYFPLPQCATSCIEFLGSPEERRGVVSAY
jgi:hypothetical protein